MSRSCHLGRIWYGPLTTCCAKAGYALSSQWGSGPNSTGYAKARQRCCARIPELTKDWVSWFPHDRRTRRTRLSADRTGYPRLRHSIPVAFLRCRGPSTTAAAPISSCSSFLRPAIHKGARPTIRRTSSPDIQKVNWSFLLFFITLRINTVSSLSLLAANIMRSLLPKAALRHAANPARLAPICRTTRFYSIKAEAASDHKQRGIDASKLTIEKTTKPKKLGKLQDLVFGRTFTGELGRP